MQRLKALSVGMRKGSSLGVLADIVGIVLR